MGNRRDEQGQGLVELALFLPILLVVVMGAIDFGRVYFAYIAIANAAREGAFYVSLNPTASNASVQGIVDAEINGQLDGGAQITAVGGSRSSGAEVTVTVQHNFQAVTTAILGQRTFPVRATAAMVVQ